MRGLVRTARNQVRRARGVERFVRLVVGGGVVLVAGLWIATLSAARSPPWLLGVALVALGVGGLAVGIRSQIDY